MKNLEFLNTVDFIWKPKKIRVELWGQDVTALEKKIALLGNRLSIFNTDESFWHGQPAPLRGLESRTRRSLAPDCYTNGWPKTQHAAPQNTVFRGASWRLISPERQGITPRMGAASGRKVSVRAQ